MGSLLIVTGPPGAGKSTVSRLLVEAMERSVLVEGDVFFGFLASDAIEPWRPEADAQNVGVTRAASSATGAFVRGGFATVYDGVVGPWFLPTFAAGTGLERFDYVVLLPPVETCVDRVAMRLGHGFTDEAATRKMHAQFTAAQIADRHVLREPLADVTAIAGLVRATRQRGDLRYAARSPTCCERGCRTGARRMSPSAIPSGRRSTSVSCAELSGGTAGYHGARPGASLRPSNHASKGVVARASG